MDVSFVTPAGALVGLLAVFALVALVRGERRSRRACRALNLMPRPRRWLLAEAVALAAVGGLLAAAAAQPVVSSVGETHGRSDAEIVVVFDVTRSMLAREGRSGTGRLDRARKLAVDLRLRIPEVKVGVASLTDRVLPHLFPSLSPHAFSTTVTHAVGIERPPPDRRARRRATALGALPDVARQNFFTERARSRIAVVFTDGETIPVGLGTLRARFVTERTKLLFVHVWDADERVYSSEGVPERYRADPTSRATLDQVATAVDGYVFSESQVGAAGATLRRLVGTGSVGAQGRELSARPLGPFVVAAAFAPLLFLIRRRNL